MLRSKESLPLPHGARSLVLTTASSLALSLALAGGALAQAPAAPAAAAEEVDTVVVTGTRLSTGLITPTPVTTLSSQAITDRAPINMAQVLAELPAVRISNNATSARGGVGTASQNYVSLRSLGTSRTLTLVDGRRRPPNAVLNGVDTNQIPTTMVERVDVVTGGASAAYGADAVAGVVNFILKDDLEGINAIAQHGFSEYDDAITSMVSVTAGRHFGDRLRIVAGAEWAKDSGVGTMLTRPWGREQWGLLSLPVTRPAGTPAQIFAAPVANNNVSRNGLIFSGPLRGLEFTPNGQQTRQFDFGTITASNQMAGSSSNLGTCQNCYADMRVPSERWTAMSTLTYEASENLEFWAHGSYYWLYPPSTSGLGYYRSDIIIELDNPYLPASVASQMRAAGLSRITLGRTNDDIGTAGQTGATDQWVAAVGARGKLFGDFRWDSFIQYGSLELDNRQGNVVIVPNYNAALYAVRDANGQIVCGPAATNPNLTAQQRPLVSPGCVPFNPFGFGNFSEAARSYVVGSENNPTPTKQLQTAINVSGDLITLPAGPVAVAFGAEFHDTKGAFITDPNTVAAVAISGIAGGYFSIGNNVGYEDRQKVYEFYAEAEVPLLSGVQFAKSLSVNGAVRHADYSTIGAHQTWKVGLSWVPVNGVRFRGTRSHDLRAPSFPERGLGTTSPANQRNPKTGVTALVLSTSLPGRLSNIGPELSDTLTYGLVFTPGGWASGLTASIDAYDIKIKGAIGRAGTVRVLEECFLNNNPLYCQYVTLDPAHPAGFSQVSNPALNIGLSHVAGVDVELGYRTPLSRFVDLPGVISLRAVASNAQINTDVLFGTTQKSAGVGGNPKWRYNVTLNYDAGSVSTYLQMNGFSTTKRSATAIGPEDANYNPADPLSTNDNRFPALAYLNFGINYNIAGGKYQLFGVIDNLMDTTPPYNVMSSAASYDVVGRTYRVGARLRM